MVYISLYVFKVNDTRYARVYGVKGGTPLSVQKN